MLEMLGLVVSYFNFVPVFENRVLRRILGPKRDEITGNGGNYIMRG
jgi:hypothetical protein